MLELRHEGGEDGRDLRDLTHDDLPPLDPELLPSLAHLRLVPLRRVLLEQRPPTGIASSKMGSRISTGRVMV